MTLLEYVKLQLQKSGKPVSAANSFACTALCDVLDHQLDLRDRADGALQQQIDWIKKSLKERDEA